MKYLYPFFLNLIAVAVSAQGIVTQDAIQDSVINQLAIFPQEKIHLHTDRTMYVPGERIWFKAYVVDAFSHQSPTYSQYAYIELINSSDSLVHRVMVSRDDNGLFHGNIFLMDFIPEGDYTLRAYTRYLENLGDDYFFKKHIRINNLKADTRPLQRQPRRQSNVTYDVSFYPEGGYLTEGVICKTAFKALNSNGESESITGEIVDRDGNRITETYTVFAGMGSFYFTPEAGKEYFLNCKNQSEQEKRFKLPTAQKTYSIAAGYFQNKHYVEVKKSPDIPEQPLYLLAHCRGEVLYYALWNHRNASVSFSDSLFSSGIIQLVLFDGQMNPVSERLIFNKNEDQAKLEFSSDKPLYEKRENVLSEICVTDQEGNPLAGHVSVAVTDNKDIEVDNLHTIMSSLLLSSELKGYIESPGYYLQDNAESKFALDLLMMTHGWRRYDISEAIKGNYKFPETEFEEAKEISGVVKNSLGRPVANGEVIVMSSEGDIGETVTDSNGFFSIYAHYPDSIKFFIQTKNQRGRTGVELIVNHEKFPALKHAPKSQLPFTFFRTEINNQLPAEVETSDFMNKAEQRAQYDEGIRMIQLSEVVVTATANRIAKRDEVRLDVSPFNKNSDITVYKEDIEKKVPSRFTDMFYSILGARVERDDKGIFHIYFKSSEQISGNDHEPILVIDGIITNMQWDAINVNDIESIDVFQRGSALFGGQGAFGVISVTMKRGLSESSSSNNSLNNISYTPTGYQKPVEFYSPKYDTPESRNLRTPDFRSTIFWKPDVLVSDDGKASFNFYTSDFPTTYSVVIEGLSNDGKIIRQVEKIEVR